MTSGDLQRWRLVLGAPASAIGPLGAEAAGRDAALDWLYGRDGELDRRDVRRTGSRSGGDGSPVVTTADWLDDITRLFPKQTVQRLQRDAVERYEIHDIVTDPTVLGRVEPNPALLKAVLRTKHLMNPDVLRLARRIVEVVVRDLMAKMATEVRTAFTGSRTRRPSRWKLARNFDVTRTIRANLGHYRPDQRRLFIQTPHFFSRTRKHIDQWQVILLVDQSGSMVDSVIHSAVTAACLWGLPGVRTHLIAFDTEVVDLTTEVDDPVELLMRVQLGGGTDIARALRYGAGLVERPRRTIMALITDFVEGGSVASLIRTTRDLCEQGTVVLGLAALDEQANPSYDHEIAQEMADVGAAIGAMTPGELVAFVAEQVTR